MKEYRELFLSESAKHLARIEELLEGRTDEAAAAVVEALFREFHSYKGMVGTMRYGAMTRFAHRVEDFLDALRSSGSLGEEERGTLLRCVDRLSRMRDAVVAGGDGEMEWADVFGSPLDAPEDIPKMDSAAKGSIANPGDKALKITILIDPDCPTPAARAFLAVSRFKEYSPDLTSEPPLEALLAGVKVERLKLTVPGLTRAEAADAYSTLTEVSGLLFDDDHKKHIAPAQAAPRVLAEPKGMMPESVEVESAALDGMVDLIGELNLMSSRIRELASSLDSDALKDEARRLEGMVRNLDASVMTMRCFPFSTIAGRLRRFVREEGERQGKKVRLTVSGGQIGVDKAVMARLSAPLTHLLRNALDHGMETPGERVGAGKAEEGAIEITLDRGRNMLKLTVADDGRGIDPVAVGRVALEKGLTTEAALAEMSVESLSAFLFMPGFSTRKGVGELSGRGVGLDAVASEIAALGGEIRVASVRGGGARFELLLPLSPAIAPALTLLAGGFTLALPVFSVLGAFEDAAENLVRKDGKVFLERGGETLVVRYLSDLLGVGERPEFSRLSVVVVRSGADKLCLAVDSLLREEHLFVKPFKGLWEGLYGLSGYSVTGSGRIVYLVDVSALSLE